MHRRAIQRHLCPVWWLRPLRQRVCDTSGENRPKGVGKGQSYGKGQDAGKGPGQARLCYNCGKLGHTKANCWELHPEKKGSGGKGQGGRARINGVDEEEQEDQQVVGLGLIQICAIEEAEEKVSKSLAPRASRDLSLIRVCDYMNSKCCMGASCPETTFQRNGNEKEHFSKNDKSDPGQSQFESKNKYAELGVTDGEEYSSEQKLFVGATASHGTQWQEAARRKGKKKKVAIEINAEENTKKTYRTMGREKITLDPGVGESVCP